MHNVKTKQTIRIVEWIIHQSHNLSEYTSIVRVKTFEYFTINFTISEEREEGVT